MCRTFKPAPPGRTQKAPSQSQGKTAQLATNFTQSIKVSTTKSRNHAAQHSGRHHQPRGLQHNPPLWSTTTTTAGLAARQKRQSREHIGDHSSWCAPGGVMVTLDWVPKTGTPRQSHSSGPCEHAGIQVLQVVPRVLLRGQLQQKKMGKQNATQAQLSVQSRQPP